MRRAERPAPAPTKQANPPSNLGRADVLAAEDEERLAVRLQELERRIQVLLRVTARHVHAEALLALLHAGVR